MAKTIIPKGKMLSPKLFAMLQKSMPIPCVDLVILRKDKKRNLETLLIKRKIYPEIGAWCLVGGRILKNEDIEGAVARQAKGELGVSVAILKPWNVYKPAGVFNVSRADAQKHYISLTYPVTITKGAIKKTGPEFQEAAWFPANKIPKKMGFIHRQQLNYALKQIKQSF